MGNLKNAYNGSKLNGPLSLKRRFWAAVESDNYDSVRKALEEGAPVNARNEERITPIIYTLKHRNQNWARITGLLIRFGADVRSEYGKEKTKLVAQNLLIQTENDAELEVVERYACGILPA